MGRPRQRDTATCGVGSRPVAHRRAAQHLHYQPVQRFSTGNIVYVDVDGAETIGQDAGISQEQVGELVTASGGSSRALSIQSFPKGRLSLV